MTHKISKRAGLSLLAALPLLVTGCGGDSSTNNGFFGGTNQSAVSPSGTPSVSPTSGTTPGSLTPNAAPASTQGAGVPGGAQTGSTSGRTLPFAEAETPNGPLAPLSGTYAGTWTPVPTATAAATDKDAASARSAPAVAPAVGGAVTLKLSYPKHASKTVLGDVSGTWADPAMGGVGRISGTVDRIGMPSEPNAVHLVGKVTFPNGKSRPLTLELAEDAVGHLGGAVTGETISLKKTR